MQVERILRHESSRARKGIRDRSDSRLECFDLRCGLSGSRCETGKQILQVIRRDGFIKRDAERSIRKRTQVDFQTCGVRNNCCGRCSLHMHAKCVEPCGLGIRIGFNFGITSDGMTHRANSSRERIGALAHTLRNFDQPIWSVIRAIHSSHYRKKNLRSADVARCTVALDVLLASLDGQSQSLRTMSIAAHANQTTWHSAYMLWFCRQKRSMRTAETHRHTESLRSSNDDVRAPRAGRCEQCHCKWIACSDNLRASGMRTRRNIFPITRTSVRVWILNEDSCKWLRGEICLEWIADDHINSKSRCACLHNGDRLWMACLRDKEGLSRAS